MKRFIAVLTVIACVGSVGGSANARPSAKSRTATRNYVAGGLAHVAPDGNTGISIQDTVGGVSFEGGSERFVSVDIADVSGQPVLGVVSQGGALKEFCGATDAPVRVQPDAEIRVWLFNGECGDGTSIATTGTVTLTFIAHR